jgi:ribosomal protein S27E
MHFFARAMYVRCFACGTLNARRRVVCRQCGDQLKK